MNKYKLSVSKGQKKYTIIVQATSEEEARERVHKEGYSILTLELAQDVEIQGKKFIFHIRDDATKGIKQGTILGEDIFKVYLKLKQELKYEVLALYSESDKDIPDTEKLKIITALRDQYAIFMSTNKVQEVVKEAKVDFKNTQTNVDDFYQKKELDETSKLVEFVLKKLVNVIENSTLYDVPLDQKDRLQEVYNNIVKIKKSTNISKLKQIGETALLKVGSIELKHLEKVKSVEAKHLLSETNKLLKQSGSTKQFREKDKDYRLMIGNFFAEMLSSFVKSRENRVVKKVTGIDKESYNYLKTVLLLNKYKKSYNENLKNCFKSFYVFLIPTQGNRDRADALILRGKVISQNIALLKAKKSGKVYSYTYVKKGYLKLVEYLVGMLYATRNYIFYAILWYAFVFVTYLNTNHYEITQLQLNFNGIFYYIISILLLCLINLSRGLLTLSLNIVFLVFLFIFWVVNF